jgi:hypothetical protein
MFGSVAIISHLRSLGNRIRTEKKPGFWLYAVDVGTILVKKPGFSEAPSRGIKKPGFSLEAVCVTPS